MKKIILLLCLCTSVSALAQPEVSNYSSSYDECMKPSMKLALDEKPVVLNKKTKGIFTVPSITDRRSKAKDFLVFFHQGQCYQIASGGKGKDFSLIKSTANELIGQ